MSDLLLIRPASEETVHSPELRYLASCVLADARRVFGTVVLGADARSFLPNLPDRLLICLRDGISLDL